MMKLYKVIILLTVWLIYSNYAALAQKVQDDFISLVLKENLYPDFEDNYRILILNILTHPNSYYKRDEDRTYLTFKVVNAEYQMVLDEAALDSSILNIQILMNSAYGRRTFYKVENGEMVECWYKERGVTFSNNSDNFSTTYALRTGYYDFIRDIERFNGFLVQKRTKNIKSKHLRRAYRVVNSIRDTQYSRLQKMIKKYDKFVAKRLKKQEKNLARSKKKMEKEKAKDAKKAGSNK